MFNPNHYQSSNPYAASDIMKTREGIGMTAHETSNPSFSNHILYQPMLGVVYLVAACCKMKGMQVASLKTHHIGHILSPNRVSIETQDSRKLAFTRINIPEYSCYLCQFRAALYRCCGCTVYCAV